MLFGWWLMLPGRSAPVGGLVSRWSGQSASATRQAVRQADVLTFVGGSTVSTSGVAAGTKHPLGPQPGRGIPQGPQPGRTRLTLQAGLTLRTNAHVSLEASPAGRSPTTLQSRTEPVREATAAADVLRGQVSPEAGHIETTHREADRWTRRVDGQTDRRTDGQTDTHTRRYCESRSPAACLGSERVQEGKKRYLMPNMPDQTSNPRTLGRSQRPANTRTVTADRGHSVTQKSHTDGHSGPRTHGQSQRPADTRTVTAAGLRRRAVPQERGAEAD